MLRSTLAQVSWRRYGIPLLSVLVAMLPTYWLSALGSHTPFPLFFGAVVFSSWYSGLAAGLLATLLGAVVNLMLFLPVVSQEQVDLNNIASISVFTLIGALASRIIFSREQQSGRWQIPAAKVDQRLRIASEELLPICAYCKKIRDARGVWRPVADYLSARFGIMFTHTVCQECTHSFYPDLSK